MITSRFICIILLKGNALMVNSPQNCENCGEILSPGARFCERCSHPIKTEAADNKKLSSRTLAIGPINLKVPQGRIAYYFVVAVLVLIVLGGAMLGLQQIQNKQKNKAANDSYMWLEKGNKASEYKENNLAIQYYDKAIELNSSLYEAYLKKGDAIQIGRAHV
jgi:hypothetical protein